MKTKIFSIVLALVLCFGLSVPVTAATPAIVPDATVTLSPSTFSGFDVGVTSQPRVTELNFTNVYDIFESERVEFDLTGAVIFRFFLGENGAVTLNNDMMTTLFSFKSGEERHTHRQPPAPSSAPLPPRCMKL